MEVQKQKIKKERRVGKTYTISRRWGIIILKTKEEIEIIGNLRMVPLRLET